MNAKKILLLASGEDKAEAMYQTMCGPITPRVPASVLRLHRDVTIIADEAAMALSLIHIFMQDGGLMESGRQC